MTVGDLRKLIAALPDDAPVLVAVDGAFDAEVTPRLCDVLPGMFAGRPALDVLVELVPWAEDEDDVKDEPTPLEGDGGEALSAV